MMLRTPLILALTLGMGLAACGGGASSTPQSPSSPDPSGTLSVEEAIATAASGPVTLRGYLVATKDASVRLCAALAESYPPQCGVASLAVEGLDLSTVEGLTTPPEPEYAHTSWTDEPVSLRGDLTDGVLTVSQR